MKSLYQLSCSSKRDKSFPISAEQWRKLCTVWIGQWYIPKPLHHLTCTTVQKQKQRRKFCTINLVQQPKNKHFCTVKLIQRRKTNHFAPLIWPNGARTTILHRLAGTTAKEQTFCTINLVQRHKNKHFAPLSWYIDWTKANILPLLTRTTAQGQSPYAM